MEVNNKCSRCGEQIGLMSNGWEASHYFANLEIGSASQAFEKLFGKDRYMLKDHPALKKESGEQRLYIEIGPNKNYKLCYKCHSELIRTIGFFLKSKISR